MTRQFYSGQSMAGTFRPGDLLFIEPVSIDHLRRGDIVVYYDSQPPPEGADTVHRVVAITPQGLICRGDNNPLPDAEPLMEGRLIGRVVGFDRRGRIHNVRGGRWGLWRARAFWSLRAANRFLTAPLRPIYRRLIRSGIVALLWKPDLRRVRFCSGDGEYVKYTRRDRTIAVWHPGRNECRFRKPYDLILWREIARDRNRNRADRG